MSDIFRTPKGVASWPFLTKPSTQFNPEGIYKVNLTLDPDTDGVSELIARCDKAVAKMKAKNKPYTEEEGNYVFKLSSKYPPALFDAHGVKLTGDIKIGSGSTIVCAVEPKPYDGFGKGLKLYLKAVQVIDLVEYTGATSEDYGFTAEEEGFSVGTFSDFGKDKADTDSDGAKASGDDDDFTW